MDPTTPRIAELTAPAAWQVVDFISDLHLQASEPATVQAWAHYMAHTRADAVFILGDLFEVWVGDDGPASTDDEARFEAHCVHTLHTTAQRRAVFLMHGNRDFLLGPHALSACGMLGLLDPTVLAFQGERWLLSHGDALCLADTDYQQFRAVVRSTDWQRDFLAKPLSEREAIARGLREQSEARKRSSAHDPSLWADVDAGAAREWLQAAGSQILIHGHTHRPDQHDLGQGLRRVVLSDWDATALPPRAEVLRLSAQDGLQRLPLC